MLRFHISPILVLWLVSACLLFGTFNESFGQEESSSQIVASPVRGKNANQEVGPIRMANMNAFQAIDLLRELSGRVIIPGENLPDLKLNFNSGRALPRKDAIFAIENLLAMNGVHLRLMDEGFVAVVPAANIERNAPVLLKDLPESTDSLQIYSKIFPLEHISESTAFQRVRNLLSARNRSGIQRIQEANALLITDSLSNLRRIADLLEVLDRPAALRHELYTFQIEHGAANNVRTQLLQALRSGFSSRIADTTVYADARSNMLWLVTHPSNYDFFNELIKEFDREVVPFTTTEVVRIERGNFWVIWGALNGIIRTQQSHFRQRASRAPETSVSTGARRLTPEGEAEELEWDAEQTDDGEVLSVEAPAADSDPNALMVEEAAPELQFSPYISLFSDPANSSIVVYGTRADIRRARALVEQLDIRSAPYIKSEVIPIVHAQAHDIRNIIYWTIITQQQTFRRAQIRPDPSRIEVEGNFEFSSFAAVIANQRDNSLLVHGTEQDLERIRDLVEKLDVEAVPITRSEVIYLEHAEAASLGRMIQTIIHYQRQAFARQRSRSQAANEDLAVDGGEQPPAGFEFSNYAVVNADRRTNALFIYGTAQDIERVHHIVKEADIPVEPTTTTRILPLAHTNANQTAAIINRLIAGQNRALNRVRSESRSVQNPAAETNQNETSGIIDGEESLQFSPFINISPDQRSNSLIVYGTASDVRQVERLIEELDIEVAPFTRSHVFLLENTQANNLFPVLNRVVQGQERALRRVRSSILEIRNIRPEDPEAEGIDVALQGLQFSPYVTITANNRNNSIIVFGTESDIKQLGNLIEASDIKTAPRTQSRTFFIRHATAADVARTINALIDQQRRVREREATLTRVFRRDDDRDSQNGLDGGGLGTDDYGNLIEETSTTSFSDLFSFDEDLQFSPYISLVADTRSNSVLAYGTTFDLEQVSHLIDQIDNVLTQVRIEVIIAEVTLSGNQVSGLESFGINYRNPFSFQDGATVDSNIGVQGSAPSPNDDGRPALEFGFGLDDFSLSSVFRVAQQDNRVKVLSAPSITTSHNQQATINVGEARPVITSSSSNLASSNLITRSEIEFRDIGITLRVRPLVGEDSHIQMDLEQVVETVIDTQTIDGNVQPIIGTRRAQSFVSVRNREVLVMGGLQSVDTIDRQGRVTLLGKIPLVGGLFRPKQQSEIVRELVIFIQPYVVESHPGAQTLQEHNLESSVIGESVHHYLENGRFPEMEAMHRHPISGQSQRPQNEPLPEPTPIDPLEPLEPTEPIEPSEALEPDGPIEPSPALEPDGEIIPAPALEPSDPTNSVFEESEPDNEGEQR